MKIKMVMNNKLQEYHIRKILKKKGIDDDLVDVTSLIDSSLTLSENINLIIEEYDILSHNRLENIADYTCDKDIFQEKMEVATKRWIRFKFKHPNTMTTPDDFLIGC
ncbi:MAG: hypothetical protein KKH52_04565 [Nanoarchaeota archaeon]|nr:hypothetical protein [Nanoarchaeota archaeon]MBU1974639.1 hypothetical protein [Nanoarchaeota archaeon]